LTSTLASARFALLLAKKISTLVEDACALLLVQMVVFWPASWGSLALTLALAPLFFWPSSPRGARF